MNIKTIVLLFVLLTFFNFTSYSQQGEKVTKVVIDAGHGGEDSGCLGKKSKEKNVNLAVALKLGKLITDNYDDVKVIYTRKTDVFIELYRRAQIANDNHANLFISIHCNAAENKSAHGIETYVMGLHKTEANLAVAKKENAAILLEKNFENNYEGFNPNSPEADVIFSLFSSAYLKNSIYVASKIQKNLLQSTGLTDRSVLQAGFWVLYKVAMPSVLIELGFLSNAKEELFLIQDSGQDIMATSIYNAFVDYKNYMEGTNKDGLTVKKYEPESYPNTSNSNNLKDSLAENMNNIPVTSSDTNFSDSMQIRFRVQFLATPDNLSVKHTDFKNIPEVRKYYENKLWKFTAGNEIDFESAKKILALVKKYFPDAFIIAFQNEQKISVTDAQKLMKK
jgi:N-acetylmuramoyl-L-alanine amidase